MIKIEILPPLNGERLVVPVISRAVNIDVCVDSSPGHGFGPQQFQREHPPPPCFFIYIYIYIFICVWYVFVFSHYSVEYFGVENNRKSTDINTQLAPDPT